jgi:hypothetical protein
LLVSPLFLNIITDDDVTFTKTDVYINTNGSFYYPLNEDAYFDTEVEGIREVEFNTNNGKYLASNIAILSSREQTAYDIGCNLVVALAWIGIILTNTVLFVKTYRVYKVTLFRRNQTIKPRNVLGPYIISVVFSATVLIALSIISPIHYSTMININDSSQYYIDNQYISNQCYGFEEINITMVAIDIIIDLGILVLAWKVRNTNEEIGESRKIFILIILLLVLDIVMVVILNYIFYDLGLIITIILTLKSLLPIWFLICPRMYYVWYEYKHGHLPESIIIPGRGRAIVGGTDNIITTAAATTTTNNNNNNNNSV